MYPSVRSGSQETLGLLVLGKPDAQILTTPSIACSKLAVGEGVAIN